MHGTCVGTNVGSLRSDRKIFTRVVRVEVLVRVEDALDLGDVLLVPLVHQLLGVWWLESRSWNYDGVKDRVRVRVRTRITIRAR